MIDLNEHLQLRYFTPELYSGVTIDQSNSTLTVALWNLSGQYVGYQIYSPLKPKKARAPRDMKYFSYVTAGMDAVWGLETVNWDNLYLFVTEGIFDAARLHSWGFAAVAVLGNNPTHLASWLKALPHRTVAAVQGDKAGLMLAMSTDTAVFLPENHDVNDLPEDDFRRLFKEYLHGN